jgi:hypothetical protein
MATRSTICIQNSDKTVTGVYCHNDGYLEHNGRILRDHYMNEASVRALIALGNLSVLGSTPDNSIAYGRDRGEEGQEAVTEAAWRSFIHEEGQEYNYIFVDGEGWYVEKEGGRILALADLLNG